ncbi:MAG: tRNA (adenosine(37)-N6)-dimethylallyltransferase MiaA [Anaerovoracaceae bacterium]
MNRNIIIIAGPTAVGKTKYAIDTALAFNGEIVSCDSMQLYKYMDIGSAKPTTVEQSLVKHYLVDEIDPTTAFSVAQYQKMAKDAIEEIFSKGKTPVIAGGTGLYLNSLVYDMDFSTPPREDQFRKTLFEEAELFGANYIYEKLEKVDPISAQRLHPNNVKKVIRALEAAEEGVPLKDFTKCCQMTKDYDVQLVGLTRNREELYDRINRRVDILIDMGLLDEVKSLLDMGLDENDISMKGIGYKEIIGYFNGLYALEDAIDLVKKNTRHYAKRQLTWFKRYKEMQWFNLSNYNDDQLALEDILKWLRNK